VAEGAEARDATAAGKEGLRSRGWGSVTGSCGETGSLVVGSGIRIFKRQKILFVRCRTLTGANSSAPPRCGLAIT
jgi:hypothetical protein